MESKYSISYNNLIVISININNILLYSASREGIQNIKALLSKYSQISDLGLFNFYLDI